jgi:hypothetical protein
MKKEKDMHLRRKIFSQFLKEKKLNEGILGGKKSADAKRKRKWKKIPFFTFSLIH